MKKAARAPRPDGEATRARILEAAGELFAAHGYAASKAIAARAEVDLASINYHFGSRSGFYQAVLAEAHRRLMDVADLQRLAQKPARDGQAARGDRPPGRERAERRGELAHQRADGGILAPSSHIQVLFESEIPRKIAVVMAIASDISGIPQDDPALQRCLLHRAPPAAADRPARRSRPVQAMLRMPAETLVDHLSRFAIAGLEAIGRDSAARPPAARRSSRGCGRRS